MSAPAPSMHSPEALALARALGLTMGRANLDAFAATLESLAAEDPAILAVTSDSRGSGKLKPFGERFPKQIVEMGIAEQNLVGVAAGLASTGKKVFAVSPGCFLTARALEQIKNDVCYSDNPVTLVGISSGVSYGALGSTHHSIHDLAVLRALHNLEVIVPADNAETRAAVRYGAEAAHPVFLRFGKAALHDLPTVGGGPDFSPGRARLVREGSDLAFLATGETVVHALLAAARLSAERGLEARVLSLPFIKPLDADAILAAARECGAIITVEEHMVHGGLGEACASLLLQSGVPCRFRLIGFPDEETVTGAQADIFRHYGISMEGLARAALSLLAP
jgi:transketolase